MSACAMAQVPASDASISDQNALVPDGAGDRIVEVRIEGNETMDASKLPKLVTRAGQSFDPQSIEEDVRTRRHG